MRIFIIILFAVSAIFASPSFTSLVGSDTLDVFLKDKPVGRYITSISSSLDAYQSKETFEAGKPSDPDFLSIQSTGRYNSLGKMTGGFQTMTGPGGTVRWELSEQNGKWSLVVTAAGTSRQMETESPCGSIVHAAYLQDKILNRTLRIGDILSDTVYEFTSGRNIPQKIICIGISSGDFLFNSFSVISDGDSSMASRMDLDMSGGLLLQEIPPSFIARKKIAGSATPDAVDLVAALGEDLAVKADRGPGPGENIRVTFEGGGSPHRTVRNLYDSLGAGVWQLRQHSDICSAVESYTRDSLCIPTSTIQSDDPLIRALSDSVCAGLNDPCESVERLTECVFRKLEKRNTPAFSNASETIRAGFGDCGEHAVLLAALLRSRGIGARVIMGLVYVRGMGYRYHAWVEAFAGVNGIYADAAFGRCPAVGGYVPLLVDNDGRKMIDLAGIAGRVSIGY